MSVKMKDSGNILIGNIPLNWNIKRIKDIVKIKISDGPHETPILEDKGIPFISAEAIKNNKVDFNKRRGFISIESHKEYSKKCKPQRNDIFIIKSGATTGNVAYVDTDIEFNIWSPLAVVRCNEYEAHYKFVYYQLLSEVFRKQVKLSWSFGTQENIGMGVLGRLFITIPPFYDQKNIANFLDKATSKIDRATKTKKAQLKSLEELKKSIIHKAVTKGLDDSVLMKDSGIEWIGDIPKHWVKDKLFRLTDFVSSGGTPTSTSQDYYNGEITWFQTGDLNNGYIKESKKKITQLGLDNSSAKIFNKGTLLIAMYGATIGKLAITSIDAATNQACCAIKFNPKTDIKFMFYIFLDMKTHLINQSYGGGQPNISQDVIKQQYLCFPKYNEQKKIVDYLGIEVEKINTLKQNVTKQVEKLEEYKKSLIYEYVTGKKQI